MKITEYSFLRSFYCHRRALQFEWSKVNVSNVTEVLIGDLRVNNNFKVEVTFDGFTVLLGRRPLGGINEAYMRPKSRRFVRVAVYFWWFILVRCFV